MKNTETVTITKIDNGYQLTVQHDQSGSTYGCDLSETAYHQLRLHFVSAMLPNLDIDKAEKLAWETDYACFAVEEDGNEINKADAGAFFLEGYNYAKGNLR